jgi:hypothetical protein
MGTSAFRLGATQTSTKTLVEEGINQTSHGFVDGDVVRSNPGVTGAFMKAQADSATNAEALGVVIEAATHSFNLVYQGECVSEDGLSSFSNGEVLFLSPDIAGKLTTSPPTLPGQVIKPMVVINDTNEGIVLNYIGTVIGGESSVEVSNLQPVGAVIPWAGATGSEPVGWLVCDGATYYGGYTGAGTTYSNLYDVIGTSFGGSGTNGVNDYFHVPNMMGRVPVGAGSGSGLTQRVLGVTGGAESSDASITSGGTIDVSAGDAANDNKVSIMQPFTVTNYLIRYEQNSRASISGLLLNDLGDAGTTGATAGDILQYEGSGTTGVYESVSIDEALTGGFTVLGGTANFIGLSGAAPTTALNIDGALNILGALQVAGNPVMSIQQIVPVDIFSTGGYARVPGPTASSAPTSGDMYVMGMRWNITPKKSDSFIVIMGQVLFVSFDNVDPDMEWSGYYHALSRNNSATGPLNHTGSGATASLHNGQFLTGSAQYHIDKAHDGQHNYNWNSRQIFFIDQPATTSATTYDLIASGDTGENYLEAYYGTQSGGVGFQSTVHVGGAEHYPSMQWVSGHVIEIG